MSKDITIIADEKNIRIECDKEIYVVINNSISSKNVFDLLNYKSGDSYKIVKKYPDSNKDILDPIYEMFNKLIEQINKLETVEKKVQDELSNVQLKNI